MSRYEPTREPVVRQQQTLEHRHVYTRHEHFHRLDEREVKTLKAIGAFRMVNSQDVPKRDADRLVRSGLIERRILYQPKGGERLEVLSLTEKGQDMLLRQQGTSDAQRYWAGRVRPAEIAHDLQVYPAVMKEVQEIEEAGGKVKRIVLDHELKSCVNSRLNKAGGPSKRDRRKELAEEYDLPLRNDKLHLPDARIEFIDAEGREQHIDVEITTEHYRGAHLAGKRASGFKLYRASSGVSRAAVRDDHKLDFL